VHTRKVEGDAEPARPSAVAGAVDAHRAMMDPKHAEHAAVVAQLVKLNDE
jgi:hypothetical protein